MKKLKDILNESQHLSYKRMNVGEEKEEKGMTNEEKREFLKAVSEYKKFGEAIYRSGNLAEVYESVKGIVETAHKVTLEETGDWFDKVTVNRHMKSMNESFKVFEKTIHEVNTLQQRLESCYDEMGEVLGKYYEIKEGNEFGAARAKAIANGDSEFEVDGKKFPVKDVDKDDKENAKKFAKESVNEEYVKSMGYKAVTDKIDSLTKSLDPNGILCKNISKKADNVKSEFKQMKKHIDSIEQLWGEVDYVIAMSSRADESVNEGRVSAKKLLQSVVKGETDRVEGIKMSKEMAQSFLDWQRLSPFGKKYGDLPFNRLFTAAFSFGLNRYADKKSKEYKELEAKANQMFKARRGESVNEGKHDAILDKLADIVKGAKSFMDIGKELKKNGIKYSFGTNMIPMYIIDKPVKIAILNNKYADGAERVVGDTAIGLMESIKEGNSMKLMDILNEGQYTVVNPKNGNVMGRGMKDQAAKLSKKMGGEKKGYFVIPVKNALKARRALEKFNFDVKNPKLKDIMSDLYFEHIEGGESVVTEGYSTEEKRIVMMAVRKISKYMNVDIKTAMMYVLGAGEELKRDIEKGKVKK